jgi:glycosyltransferase involved in cell wall biosynthesis
MRVLHVGKYYPPVIGGMERIVQLMARALSAHDGVDVDVLVANRAPRGTHEIDREVGVRRLATYGALRSVPLTPSMLTSARTFAKYDIVHIHSPNPLPELSWMLLRPPTRLVASDWGQITRQRVLRRLWRPLYAKYFESASAVTVPSRRYAQNFAHLRECGSKLFDVPLGVDLEGLKITPEVARRVEAHRARSPLPTVLFVGRLVPFKGAHLLLQAAVALEARIMIVGDGPERTALEAKAKTLGVSDRVEFLGSQIGPDLVAAYYAADVFALPSIAPNEAFPQALLEVLACGVPAVTTELGTGTSEINRDGVTGLVVPPSDPKALTVALERILHDRPLAEQFRSAALARARTDYSVQAMAERLLACYRWCLGEGTEVEA